MAQGQFEDSNYFISPRGTTNKELSLKLYENESENHSKKEEMKSFQESKNILDFAKASPQKDSINSLPSTANVTKINSRGIGRDASNYFYTNNLFLPGPTSIRRILLISGMILPFIDYATDYVNS